MKTGAIALSLGILSLVGWGGCATPPAERPEAVTRPRPVEPPPREWSPPVPALPVSVVRVPPSSPSSARESIGDLTRSPDGEEAPVLTEILMVEAWPVVAPEAIAGPAELLPPTPPEPDQRQLLVPTFAGARPSLIRMPVPVFPETVDFDRVFPGWVEFEVELETDGSVIDADILEASSADLREPLLRAVRGAQYTVARDPNGMAVRVTFRDRIEL